MNIIRVVINVYEIEREREAWTIATAKAQKDFGSISSSDVISVLEKMRAEVHLVMKRLNVTSEQAISEFEVDRKNVLQTLVDSEKKALAERARALVEAEEQRIRKRDEAMLKESEQAEEVIEPEKSGAIET
jgi:Spy/CpxP family protein refolding chaperone